MYKTMWDADQSEFEEEVVSFINSLEKDFVNTDGQIQVKKQSDGTVEVHFEVFNKSPEEAQTVFNSFENEIQIAFGYESYTLRTDSSKAVAEI